MIDREQFAKDNFNLIYKFLSIYHINDKRDDVLDILFIGYTKALNLYDKDKGSFSSLAFSCMSHEFLNWYKTVHYISRKPDQTKISLDAYIDDTKTETLLDFIPDKNVNIEEDVLKKVQLDMVVDYTIQIAKERLTKREYQVFIDYYINNKTLLMIAKEYNLSKQRINQLQKAAIRKVTKRVKEHFKYDI